MLEEHIVTVAASGFAIEGFHSRSASVEHLHVSEIEDILFETLVSCLVAHSSLVATQVHFQLHLDLELDLKIPSSSSF